LELRRLISHHGLQRRKLVSARSALNELREEAHNMRTSAESLIGRVDRVLYNTIQVVQDGDVVISSIGLAFDDAPEPQVGTDNIGPSGNTPEHNSSEIPAPNIGHLDHSHNTGHGEQIIYQMTALLEASPIISGPRSAYLMRCTENSHHAEQMRTRSNTGTVIKHISD
jgi:hypothetical protein